jgi:nucleoid DNA-binding protein
LNHNQTVSSVARRLRHLTKRDISEVLTVLVEVWHEALLQPDGYIRIDGLGKLYIEKQQLRSAGVIQAYLRAKHGAAPARLDRYYFRFRPSESLRAALMAAHKGGSKQL